MSLILFYYFERVCKFRRVQLSTTVNIRHCMRMNNFLSEADLVSINICFNQNYRYSSNIFKKYTKIMILGFGALFLHEQKLEISKICCVLNAVKYKLNPPPFLSHKL